MTESSVAETEDAEPETSAQDGDCTDFHAREEARKWARTDAQHCMMLAAQALSGACQVLRLDIDSTAFDTKAATKRTTAVADGLLAWLLTNCPMPSAIQEEIDEHLPALDDPHDNSHNMFANFASFDPGGKAGEPMPDQGGGVYL